MPTRRPKFPAGCTLRCACGRIGTIGQITAHHRASRLPECQTEEIQIIDAVTPDPPPTFSDRRAISAPAPAPVPVPEPEPEPVPDGAEPWPEEWQEIVPAEEPPALPPVVMSRPAAPPHVSSPQPTNGNGNGKGHAKERQLHWRQPPPTPDAQGLPRMGVIRLEADLPARLYTLYELTVEEGLFQGTFPDFLWKMVYRYFRLIGFDGLRLVRRLPPRAMIPAPLPEEVF